MALTKMYAFLLLIYLGGTVLPCVKSFSDGNFDLIPNICVNMNVEHDAPASSAVQSTFTVNPDNITITDANLATPIPVSLQSAGAHTFRGFMLEARTAADNGPAGVFTLVDSTKSRLQSCSGFSGNAVTQINNQDKSAVDVLWTAPAVGQYFFRATVVVNSEVTWLKQPVVILTTTTPTTTTTTTTTATTTTTTTTTASTKDTALPTQSSVMKKCRIWFLVLLLPSYLCLVECLSLLLKHRRQQNVILMKVLSVVSLVFSIAAFIVVLILTDLVAAKILIGVIVALGLCHTILIFLFVGPSHERRRHLCWAFGLIVFADLCLTTAAIFLGLVMLDVCVWVIIAMAVYVAFDVLFFIIFISCFASKKLRQNNQEVAHPVSYWCTCFVIFTVVNIAFTVAVIVGIFVCIGCP